MVEQLLRPWVGGRWGSGVALNPPKGISEGIHLTVKLTVILLIVYFFGQKNVHLFKEYIHEANCFTTILS